MWILTREINQYDQDGEYFVACWTEKPSADQIAPCLPVWLPQLAAHASYAHYLHETGGGRIGLESEWYKLFQHADGVLYEPD